MWSSISDRKYRIPEVKARVARRSWSHRPLAATSCARSARRTSSVGLGRPVGDAVADLVQAAQADPAGDRLAARLVGREARQQAGEVDDARPVVGDHHRARAEVGARLAQGGVGVRRVELVGRQQAAGRPADEDRLQPVGPGSAREVDELAEGRPERDLGDAAARPARGAGRGSCPGRPGRRSPRTPRRPGERSTGRRPASGRC